MDSAIKEGAARYDAAQREGQRFIKRCWRVLQAPTKSALMSSGFYSSDGVRVEVDYPASSLPEHDVERLEHAIGVMVRCKDATLPDRSEVGVTIPPEALESELLTCVGELLFVQPWHDANFLRLGLYAVAAHLRANALTMVGPRPSTSVGASAVSAILRAVLVLTLPASMGMTLLAVERQDTVHSVLWLYAVSAGILSVMSLMKLGLPKPQPFEIAYDRWTDFRFNDAVGVTGAGALEHLRTMADDGVRVPSVAFDLADALRARMGSAAPSESLKASN